MEFKFCYFAKLKFRLSSDFTNLPMIAYIIEFKDKNLLIINSVKLTIFSQVAKLNSVYVYILQIVECVVPHQHHLCSNVREGFKT